MALPSTVGALEVLDVLAALGALGLEPGALCRTVRLRPATLQEPAARVPAAVVVALFAEAERRTGDPLVGLHAGEHAEPRGPLAYLVMSNPRLEDGLRPVERFSHLAIDTLRIRLQRGPDTATLVIDPGEALAGSRHLTDYVMIACVRVLRSAVGPDFPLREVHVRHPAWQDPAEPARAFRCPVRSDQAENRLVFPLAALEARGRIGNPLIAAQIEKFAAALVPHPATSFRASVAEVTRALLSDGIRPACATVARRLHVSDRTLQRRLDEELTTFKAVRDAVLWEVVDALLSNPALKVEAVALSVGFGEVAAFSKAFKRRAGCSPTQYRERLAARAMRRQRLRVVDGRGARDRSPR